MIPLCLCLGIACYFDYRKRKIPNVLIYSMLPVGIIDSILARGIWGMPGFLLRAVCVMAIFYPLFKIGVLGAGDVKLFGICAGFLSFPKFLFFLFFSLLFAAILSLLKMVKEQNALERMNYFCQYVWAVTCSGKFFLYGEDESDGRKYRICLAGPMLASLLLGLGGIY